MSLRSSVRQMRQDCVAIVSRWLGIRHFDSGYFEKRFRVKDPWGFEDREYERQKYQRTLRAINDHPVETAIEIGCAEGLFTSLLAPHVGNLLAVDISETALARARDRLQHSQNVSFSRWDLFTDGSLGRFDLVVCSEVLYFSESSKALDAALLKIAAMCKAGGVALLVHLRVRHEHPQGWDARDLLFGADTIHKRFQELTGARPVLTERTELYAIDKFQMPSP